MNRDLLFLIIAAAGGADKAIVEQFTTTATSSGQIVIQFTTITDNAKASGIEILAGSSGVTPTPTQASGASCSVHYNIVGQWTSGFQGSLTITNTGSTTINGWSLSFSFPNGQTITQLWNGSYTQSGSNVTVTNASYNASIPAGQTLGLPPGFLATWNNSTNSPPTAFTLNGAACTVV